MTARAHSPLADQSQLEESARQLILREIANTEDAVSLGEVAKSEGRFPLAVLRAAMWDLVRDGKVELTNDWRLRAAVVSK